MSRSRNDWLAAAVLAAITFAVFRPAMSGEFVNFDDFTYVSRNPNVLNGLSASGVRWAFTTFQTANWHPLTWLSLQLDATLWRPKNGDASGFHCTNVVVHAANAALLFLVLRTMTGAFWRSAAVALLFAVHPLRVESVAWIAERKDVLSGFFGLLALWAYAAYARAPSVLRYLSVALALTLSLLCKPMLVSLPFLMLVLDWWPLRRWPSNLAYQTDDPADPRADFERRDPTKKTRFTKSPTTDRGAASTRGSIVVAKGADAARELPQLHLATAMTPVRLVAEKLPLLVLIIASSVITYRAQANQGAVLALEEAPLLARLANATVSYGAYLAKTVWPVDLAVFYPHPGAALRVPQTIAASVVLGLLTVAAIALRRRAPYLLTGWLWYLGTLVPVIGLVQVGVQAYADRYTYFPQIGLLLALCWGTADLLSWRPCLALGIGVFTAAAFAGLTIRQIGFWHDSLALWKHSLEVTGRNTLGLTNLAETLEHFGQLEKATALYREAIDLAPDSPRTARAYINLGNNLKQLRRLDEAMQAFEKASQLQPDSPTGYTNLGVIYLELGASDKSKLDKAAELFDKACAVAPNDYEPFLDAGTAEEQRDNFAVAEARYRRAIALRPDSPQAYTGLGVALLQQGQIDAGLEALRHATVVNPKYENAYALLGKALLVRGRHREAADCFARVLEFAPNRPAYWTLLNQCLSQIRKDGDSAIADQIEQRVLHFLPPRAGSVP